MNGKLITVVSMVCFGLLGGCSSSGSNNSETTGAAVVVVSAADAVLSDNAGQDVGLETNGVESGSTTQASESEGGISAGSESTGMVDGQSITEGSSTASGAASGGPTTEGGVSGGTTSSGAVSAGSTTEGSTTSSGVVSGDSTTEGGISGGTTSSGVASGGSTTEGGTTASSVISGDSTGEGGESSGTTSGFASGGDTTSGATESPYPAGSLADVLHNDGGVDIALAALQDAGLDFALDDIVNTWTVFLPTDDAITADPLFDIQRHIHVRDALTELELTGFNGGALLMNNGQNITVNGGGDVPLLIGNASVLETNLVGNAGSSIVHIIDTVITEDATSLYPEGSLADVLVRNGNVSRALAAFRAEGLDLSIGDIENEWTVFLPNDDAMEASADFDAVSHIYTTAILPSDQLDSLSGSPLALAGGNTEIIEGGATEPLSIGGALVLEVDITGNSNLTVVHIIDTVLE